MISPRMISDTEVEEDVKPEDANEEAKEEGEATDHNSFLSGTIKCCRPCGVTPSFV